jgi:hypothetical protein
LDASEILKNSVGMALKKGGSVLMLTHLFIDLEPMG